MAYELNFSEGAVQDLMAIRVYERRRITDDLRRQLLHHPDVATRRRKILGEVPADFDYEPPLWELRIGDYRAFYTVQKPQSVRIDAVRLKPPQHTTKEALHENNDD